MVDRGRMADLATRFDPPAEVIADYRGVCAQSDFKAGRDSVLEIIERRPCSLEDIADGLRMHRNEVIKYVEELDAKGLLEKRSSGGKLFYSGKHQPEETQE
jgi:biotin operon repressor